MDLAATVIAALIFVAAALSMVGAGISEMHGYNSVLRAFRELSLETAGSNTPWFSDCQSVSQLNGTKRCLHGSEETLILGEPGNE